MSDARVFAGRAARFARRNARAALIRTRAASRRLRPERHAASANASEGAPPRLTETVTHDLAAVWSGNPATDLGVVVVADERVRALLEPHWRTLGPGDVEEADLVVIDLTGSSVPAGAEEVCALARAAGRPVLAMVPPGAAPELPWMGDVEQVEIAPFGQPLTQGPAASTASGRDRAAAVGLALDGHVALPDAARRTLADLTGRLDLGMMHVVGVEDPGQDLTLPDRLPLRIQEVGPWSEVGGACGRSPIQLDLSGSNPRAAWSTIAAALGGSAVVGLPGLWEEPSPWALPDDLRAVAVEPAGSGLDRLLLAPDEAAWHGHRAMRQVLRGHTAGHRVARIFERAGFHAAPVPPRTVTVLLDGTGSDHRLVEAMRAQAGIELELVALGIPDAGTALEGVRAVAGGPTDLGPALRETSGDLILVLPSSAHGHGPQLLADLVDALHAAGADVVGKGAWTQLGTDGEARTMHPDRAHRYGVPLLEGTQLWTRTALAELAAAGPPPSLRSLGAAGGLVWSADPYNLLVDDGTGKASSPSMVARYQV